MTKRSVKMKKVLLSSMVVCLAFGAALLNNTEKAEQIEAKASTETLVEMKAGASIRYDAPAGIRFTAFVADSLFDDTATHDLKDNVTVGMYLLPSSYADESTEAITSTTSEHVVSVDSAELGSGFVWCKTSEKSGYQQFNVAIYNIPTTSYTEDVFARAYVSVDGTETLADSTVKRCITEVANAALAADTLLNEGDADKLTDGKVSALEAYTAGETTLGAVSVNVLDNVASWSAVENAVAYLVKTDDDKVVRTEELSYAVTGKEVVSVVAYGDGETYTYSTASNKKIHALDALELANFNDDSYIADLEAGNSNLPNYDFSATASASWHTNTASYKFYEYSTTAMTEATPVINKEKVGVDGGAADFNCCVTAYTAMGTRFSVFSVNLQKSLNFDHSGIRVRLMIGGYGGSTAATAEVYNLRLADAVPDNTTSNALKWYGYCPENATYPFKGTTKVLAKTDFGTWIDWYITSEEMEVFYKAGDSKLVFTLEHAASLSAQYIIQANILVDDISYYDMYAPTNVALDESTMNLSWDAVDGATGYVVDVNGTTYETTATSMDLSDILSAAHTAEIKVKAIGEGKSSPYSGTISFSIIVAQLAEGQLASFDMQAYENMVATLPKGEQGSVGGNKIQNVTYVDETACVDSTGGALDITIKATSGRNADFKVTFAEAIDLTDYDGISIRFKVYDKSYYEGGWISSEDSKLYLKLLNTTGSKYTGVDTTSTKEVSGDGWVTITFDSAWVEKCLLNNNTQLTFSLFMGGTYVAGALPNRNGAVGLYLDDISYYTADS